MGKRIDWKKLCSNLSFVWEFSKDDFKSKYAASFLGIFWAFIQPIITVVTYWFIFQIGFKSAPVKDFPFVLWLTSGLLPWFFISESILNATGSMVEYSYLVKKIVFKIDILPFVKIQAVFWVQLVLLVFTQLLFILYGIYPDIYCIQIIYYLIYAVILVVGISYLTAALYVFFKDLIQIINIIIQFVFWLTPIVWDYNIMSENIRKVLSFNPFYYIVNGYRDSYVNKIWFWENGIMGIYYWVIAISIFIIGRKVFKNLKPHFADVL